MGLPFEPAEYAQELANYSVAAMLARLQTQQATVKTEQNALSTLKTALSDFRTALQGFSSDSSGVVKNTATASTSGYINLKANADAKKGLYHIDVEETAKAAQNAYTGLTDADIASATGSLKLTIDGEEMEIDLDDVSNLSELRDKINASSDNPGATASLIRQNGEVKLLLSSDKSGEKNQFVIDASGSNIADKFDATNKDMVAVISEASDAVVKMGDMVFTSDSNTFKDLIPGVELTVMQKTEAGKPIAISVENDTSATQEQAQAFVDAYNALRKQLDTLTKSGNADGGRGPLAGDSGIRALEQQLNGMLREGFNGSSLSDFGISPDKEGQLKLDSKAFQEALAEHPEKLNGMFDGANGLLKKMDKGLDSFLSTSTGTIKARQETLDRKNEQLTQKNAQIESRYNTNYERYLKEFTRAQMAMTQIENTMASFFS